MGKLKVFCYVMSPKDHKFDGGYLWPYPENKMSLEEQRCFIPPKDLKIITQSPFIIGNYWAEQVRIWKNGKFIKPERETYGASLDYIVGTILGLDLISERPLNDMKEAIRSQSLDAIEFAIQHFGESFEKRFLYQERARLKETK